MPKTIQELEARVNLELADAGRHPNCASLARQRIPPACIAFTHPKLRTGWMCFRDTKQNRVLILCADPYDDREAWIVADASAPMAADPEATVFAGSILEFLKKIDTLKMLNDETQKDGPQQGAATLPSALQSGRSEGGR
jgi:hypothetical protein